MKTIILSAAAIAAFTGAAFADYQSDTVLERRFDAHGNTFFVHVRPEQATTTVALYRQGRGVGYARDARYETARQSSPVTRDDQHGRAVVRYAPER